MGQTISTGSPLLVIVKVAENSPAHRSGLLPFVHFITEINNSTFKDSTEARTLLLKTVDRKLKLKIINGLSRKITEVEIERGDEQLGLAVKLINNPYLLSLKITGVKKEAQYFFRKNEDFIIGVENIFCGSENDFYKEIFRMRTEIVNLCVLNIGMQTIRLVSIEVQREYPFIGCSLRSEEFDVFMEDFSLSFRKMIFEIFEQEKNYAKEDLKKDNKNNAQIATADEESTITIESHTFIPTETEKDIIVEEDKGAVVEIKK